MIWGGRNAPEWVAGFLRNRWPESIGIGGRLRPESAAGIVRNMQISIYYLSQREWNYSIKNQILASGGGSSLQSLFATYLLFNGFLVSTIRRPFYVLHLQNALQLKLPQL